MIFGDREIGGLDAALKLGERVVRVLESGSVMRKDESVSPKLTVETIDNQVYFYAAVDSDRCLAMLRTIKEVDARLRNERATRNIPKDVGQTPIWLHIHSGGGDLFSGLSAADQLATIQTPIYSVVEGLCASAATLISLACTKRFITPSGFMLIHQLSNGMWGKHEEFKDEIRLQEMMMQALIDFYSTRTKMKKNEIVRLLKRDSWFNAKQCVENGLAQELMQ